MIQKSKGYSDVTIYHDVMKELETLQREIRVEYRLLFTPVKYIEMQYDSSMRALVEGDLLAVVVVFLFLRDWRATLISAIAIPLSAIPAFWFMGLMGFTLNMVTLLSLSLVAGVLVDDAIVEIENIVRHMRMGKSAYQAAIDAADEIGLPVVATTFSIVAVFLPVSMMGGIIGQYFISFGLTIVITVLISLAVARMITPMIAAYFLKAKGHAKHGEGWLMDRISTSCAGPWSIAGRRCSSACAFVAQIFAFAPDFTFQPNTGRGHGPVAVECRRASRSIRPRGLQSRGRRDAGAARRRIGVRIGPRRQRQHLCVAEGSRRRPRSHQHRLPARGRAPARRHCRCARHLPQPEPRRRPRRFGAARRLRPGQARARRARAGRADAAAVGVARAAYRR